MKRYMMLIFLMVFLPLGAITVDAATPISSPYGSDSLLNGVVLKSVRTGLPAPELTDRDTDTYLHLKYGNADFQYTHTFPSPVGIERVWIVGSKGNIIYVEFTFEDGTKSTPTLRNTSSFPMVATESPVNLTKPVRSIRIYGNGTAPYIHEVDLSRIKDTIPPLKPNGLTAQAGFDRVNLSWDANKDLDIFGYNIYVDGVKEKVATRTSNYSVYLNDYTKTYSFYITAIDTSGNESVPSETVMSTPIEPPDTTPPSRPYGLKATAEVGQVSLTWIPNIEPDLAGYLIYKDGRLLFTVPITDIDFVVSGGMSYTDDSDFSIVAVDFTGNVSMRSTVVKVRPIKPTDNIPPDVPLGLTAVITPDYLKIRTQWGVVTDPDLDGYYIYVSKNGGATWTRSNPPPVKTTTYEIEPIDPDTEYQIKITAIDLSGNESGFSNTVTIRTPTQTTVVTPVITPDYMDITWLPIQGAVKYLIYYNGKKVGEAPSGTHFFKITKAMGYNYNGMLQVVDVKAQFANGGIGGGSNQPGRPVGSGWGFDAVDIFKNGMWLVASVSSLVLFGIVMKFVPKMIKMINNAMIRRKGRME